jgi:D-alanyl-D-alanine carboxypeptidase
LGLGLSATQAQASKYASIVIEEATGKVLFSRNADNLRYPASLTKIMTLYLLFEDIEAGRMTLKSRIPVSKTGRWSLAIQIISETGSINQRRTGHLRAGDKIGQ